MSRPTVYCEVRSCVLTHQYRAHTQSKDPQPSTAKPGHKEKKNNEKEYRPTSSKRLSVPLASKLLNSRSNVERICKEISNHYLPT